MLPKTHHSSLLYTALYWPELVLFGISRKTPDKKQRSRSIHPLATIINNNGWIQARAKDAKDISKVKRKKMENGQVSLEREIGDELRSISLMLSKLPDAQVSKPSWLQPDLRTENTTS